jgi:hypothetical protein
MSVTIFPLVCGLGCVHFAGPCGERCSQNNSAAEWVKEGRATSAHQVLRQRETGNKASYKQHNHILSRIHILFHLRIERRCAQPCVCWLALCQALSTDSPCMSAAAASQRLLDEGSSQTDYVAMSSATAPQLNTDGDAELARRLQMEEQGTALVRVRRNSAHSVKPPFAFCAQTPQIQPQRQRPRSAVCMIP